MTGGDAFWADPKAISTLVDETRTVREALHALVERTRQERHFWEESVSGLSTRVRLTRAQQLRLRRHTAPPPGRT